MKKIFLIFLGLPVRAKICGVSFGRFGHEKAEIQLKNAESCEFQIHPEGDGKVKFRLVFIFDSFLAKQIFPCSKQIFTLVLCIGFVPRNFRMLILHLNLPFLMENNKNHN